MALNEREQVHGPGEASKSSEDMNLFERIIAIFLGTNDPEKEKKKLLKGIAKELKKSKGKFYDPKGEQALPGMAKFFYEIYKTVGPAQTLLQNADSSGVLRNIIIESRLTGEQLSVKESLSEEAIRERAKTTDTKQLISEIKDSLVGFFSAFDNTVMKDINSAYFMTTVFHTFIMFDYYFLLKKFDSNFPDKDFGYSVRFEAINGEYISDDLKDFLEVFLPLDKAFDWGRIFDTLKEYRNVDVVSRPAWTKMMSMLDEVRNSGLLELIVRHADKDPHYKPVMRVSNERIVEPYLNKFKTQTELTIQKILQERKHQQIDKLAASIFGAAVIPRMKNYTEKGNVIFSKKMLAGFIHTEAANYLKAFMLDFVKKDVRELRDLLIVRGKWATNLLSQQLSESFHLIMELSDNLIKFDDACADEGEYGVRIRKVINRADRDQGAMKILRETVKGINERAAALIGESAQNFIAFGKNLKTLLDDFDMAPHHEILINWKEVDNAAENRIRDRMVTVYKKIYNFIQLLQMFVKSEKK